MQTNEITQQMKKSSSWKYSLFFTVAILLGIANGLWPTNIGLDIAQFLSDIFIRMFKFVSVPIIGVTICLTISRLGNTLAQKQLWKRTLFYTLTTTIASASVAAILFYILAPENVTNVIAQAPDALADKKGYLDYFVSIVPDNPLAPFVQGSVLSILLIAIVCGIAIRHIEAENSKITIQSFLTGIQSILFFIVKWIIRLLPFGIFGFTTICIKEFISGVALGGLGTYFTIVVSSNIIQGLIILPIFLLIKKINPFKTMKNMSKALIIAFFSKSSAGTLPITMMCAEENLKLNPKVSRFVLPICTTINMNGCAAFILTTVVYLMQNNGTEITPMLLTLWVGIATISAIGNAGVPMGCFFLSASLLSSMNVPIVLMGIILPFYAVLDMIETSLNVWSDSCVATMVNKDTNKSLEEEI
jgi:Na+/H+-dicarboxylate symporter